MAIESMPLFGGEDETYWYENVAMSGTPYLFEFAYNERVEAWYVHVYQQDGTLLRAGRKVSVNWPIFLRETDQRMFTGYLLPVRKDQETRNPNDVDFGLGNVEILHFTEDDASPELAESTIIIVGL